MQYHHRNKNAKKIMNSKGLTKGVLLWSRILIPVMNENSLLDLDQKE
jgi:hypothetical protein